MPFTDPWFSEGKSTSPLDYERRLYEHTGNPLHAWRAYEICSELMRGGVYKCDSLPAWLLDYLDGISSTIKDLYGENYEQLQRPDRNHIAESVVGAVGIMAVGQGARSTAFVDERLERRDRRLAVAVIVERRKDPNQSLDDVFYSISVRKGIGLDVVKRAWSRWGDFEEV